MHRHRHTYTHTQARALALGPPFTREAPRRVRASAVYVRKSSGVRGALLLEIGLYTRCFRIRSTRELCDGDSRQWGRELRSSSWLSTRMRSIGKFSVDLWDCAEGSIGCKKFFFILMVAIVFSGREFEELCIAVEILEELLDVDRGSAVVNSKLLYPFFLMYCQVKGKIHKLVDT